jgi:hypothetical protein
MRTVSVRGGDRAPGERMPALSGLLAAAASTPRDATPALVIEKGIPIPQDRVRGVPSEARRTLEAMEPGDSVLIPMRLHSAGSVRLMVRNIRKSHPDRVYVSRAERVGLRVWRAE